MWLLQHIKNIVIFFVTRIYRCFFVFYPIREIYIWSTMTFIIQQLNIIKDKLTISHRFQIILISIFKWIKKFICIIANHDFYTITFWMCYMLFIIIMFRRNKTNCWRFLNMVYFYQDILQLIVFYFYHSYFCIQYNCYSKNHLLLQLYNNFLLLHA